jgi:hypothetical protein
MEAYEGTPAPDHQHDSALYRRSAVAIDNLSFPTAERRRLSGKKRNEKERRKHIEIDPSSARLLPSYHSQSPRAYFIVSLLMERISTALIRITPCSDFNEKFPESSFSVISPSIGRNRPVSGRSVTLTRSPTASAFKEFAKDSNIAIDPPILARGEG